MKTRAQTIFSLVFIALLLVPMVGAAYILKNDGTITINSGSLLINGMTVDNYIISVAGVGGGSFDQSLNTTDDVTFANVTSTQGITLNGDYRTAWPSSAIVNVSNGRYTHIVNSANDLETVIEGLGAGSHAIILANWTSSSVSSIVLPDVSSAHIEVYGLGMGVTTITGDTDAAVFYSAKIEWAAGTCLLELHEISVTGDSDMCLNIPFWHTIVKNAIFNVYANSNAKGIIIGGSGADGFPTYWESVTINHYGGVTTNSLMRIWLENFIGVGINIVLKSSVDIGNMFELLGTSSTFIKTNLHQWQGRDITSSVFYINGDGHYCQIFGFYGAESGGTASIVGSLLRMGDTSTSQFTVYGNINTCEDDAITQIYYNDNTMRHTTFDAHVGKDGGDYVYDPVPSAITINLMDRETSTTSWTPGTNLTYSERSGFNTITLNLTGYTKIKFFGSTIASLASANKSVAVWDKTNNQVLANYTWNGNTAQEFETRAFNIQTVTGPIQISLYGYGSTNLEIIYMKRFYIVLYN